MAERQEDKDRKKHGDEKRDMETERLRDKNT